VRATANQLRELCERRLEKLKLVALLIDGMECARQTLVVALGVEENGAKHVLGLWPGATGNATVAKALLEDLVARGLNQERRYLFVLDGSKALRAAIHKVFGEEVEVQRCPLHKRRNGKDHLPKPCRGEYDRRLRNAYALSSYPEAQQALERRWRQLCEVHPSAARNVKRWRAGDHIARWTTAGLLEAEKKFRQVKGYRELKELNRILNPELHSQAQVA